MKFYQIVLALLFHLHKALSILTGAVKYDDAGDRYIDLYFLWFCCITHFPLIYIVLYLGM